MQCPDTNLSHAFGDRIGRRMDLRRVRVEQEVIVTKVWPRAMPMKVLRLHVQGKHVCKEQVESGGDIFRRLCPQIGRGI
jgi:hypothetical protein